MIAIDTNLLVYAHRKDSPFHDLARSNLAEVSRGRWGIPWHCLHEFYAIVTHPRIFKPPTKPSVALAAIDAWIESPQLSLLCESEVHWETLRDVLSRGKIAGPAVYDARIAAICLQHGVAELWTADRDFSRFPDLRTRNPLIPK